MRHLRDMPRRAKNGFREGKVTALLHVLECCFPKDTAMSPGFKLLHCCQVLALALCVPLPPSERGMSCRRDCKAQATEHCSIEFKLSLSLLVLSTISDSEQVLASASTVNAYACNLFLPGWACILEPQQHQSYSTQTEQQQVIPCRHA